VVGSYEGYRLVRHGGGCYAIPAAAGRVNLNRAAGRRHPAVIRGETWEQVQERIDRTRDAVPIEFAGWLPIFTHSGNCGQHPQFQHTAHAPAGYRFTCSGRPLRRTRPGRWRRRANWLLEQVTGALWALRLLVQPFFRVFRAGARVGPRARLRVLGALLRLFVTLRRRGARLGPVLRFLRTRHFHSQVLLARYRGLVFLPSIPYTYNQNPWVVEIEDPTTLFYPLIQNGRTHELRIAESPYFPIIQTLLESDQCKAIVTHIRSTATLVRTLFQSQTIREKVYYTPLGVRLPECWQRHPESQDGGPINLLFTNSWCQEPGNFCLRGGLDVLEAFAILHERYPQLRLTVRANLPRLPVRYQRIMEAGWVRVISRFLSARELDALLADSHVFLLPAARVHIVSLLQAMSYGLAVVTSDGWGIEEYIDHERNGLVVKGRYGKVSWADEEAGMLRENYEHMYRPDQRVVGALVRAVSRLVEEPALRRRLGRTARRDVETTYNLERWNAGLKEIFDRALFAAHPLQRVGLTDSPR
jgi:glycosyltransferase involved in cell wall biosynthesis